MSGLSVMLRYDLVCFLHLIRYEEDDLGWRGASTGSEIHGDKANADFCVGRAQQQQEQEEEKKESWL